MSAAPESKPLVLVVDDDELIRRLVQMGLSERFEVYTAANAFEAIELVGQHDIEVVVIDVMMPGMTGIQALPLLKAKARGPLPVLLLTALGDQESRNAGLQAGADDYLAKPIDRRELLLRVQNFVRMRRQEQVIRTQVVELEHLQAMKDDLTALLVHDLKNPLTAVKSALQLMEANVVADDVDIFRMGSRALDRVMEGVEDLLKVRMLEEGQLPLSRVMVNLSELGRDVADTLHAAALDGKVHVRHYDSGDAGLRVDVKLMKRALENLLINAFRHTREEVDITVSGEADKVILSVADRGAGVPDVLKGELFDMFGSLALQESGGRRGHGLGLYLVKLVAQAHGGEVVVRDREGGGADFAMSLPRHPLT